MYLYGNSQYRLPSLDYNKPWQVPINVQSTVVTCAYLCWVLATLSFPGPCSGDTCSKIDFSEARDRAGARQGDLHVHICYAQSNIGTDKASYIRCKLNTCDYVHHQYSICKDSFPNLVNALRVCTQVGTHLALLQLYLCNYLGCIGLPPQLFCYNHS